jgi:small GTP-binding protein
LALNPKLVQKYDQARRDQREVLDKLLDALNKVDNLPSDQLEQVQDAVFHANYPYLIVLVGPFSAGKSSLVNSLLGKAILNVGPVPTTDHIHIIRYGEDEQRARVGESTTIFYPHPLLQSLSFVDTPGLESVFEKHDSITRRFLHRADLVLMVMVATQALTARNLEVLKELKAYGKRVILVVNQVDLLEESERDKVRDFVAEQSQLQMGFEPLIWMLSSKQALEAQQETPRDEILYDESGFAEVEEYLNDSLNDENRIRQKLETSLQIAGNVREKGAALVQANLATLSDQQKTLQNIQGQIAEALREQEKVKIQGLAEIDRLWESAADQGSLAIWELFQFNRAFGQAMAGLGEIFGLGMLSRRFGARTRAQAAWEQYEVGPAFQKIPAAVEALGARLEGRDLKDLDDLVTYTKTQVTHLPPHLKAKMMGQVQGPLSYDRGFLRKRRDELEKLMTQATRDESTRLDRDLQNMLVALALWEGLVIVLAALVALLGITALEPINMAVFLFGAIIFVILGLALLPLRGWMVNRAYRARISQLALQHHKILEEALSEAYKYGGQIREEAVAPFTRLIQTQSGSMAELKQELDEAQAGILRIQHGLAALSGESK